MYDIGPESGHPLRVLRTQLDLTQKELADKVGVGEATIVRAEHGYRLSAKVRRQLCDHLGKTSEELGLFGRKQDVIHPSSPPVQEQKHASFPPTIPSQSVPVHSPSSPTIQVNNTHAIAPLAQPSLNASFSLSIGQQENTWLVQGASYLGQLFNDGWSMDEILTSAQIVLQGMQGMPAITRQHLLQWEIASMLRDIPVLTGKHILEEERQRLYESLTKSTQDAWKLFHSAGNAQVLAVGQALLSLVQRNDSYFPSNIRPMYYAAVYDLIGIALHFQERDVEALQAYRSGNIAALSTGDAAYVATNLICQSDCYNALHQYHLAIQRLEEALRIVGQPTNELFVQLKAHILTCWADNAMMLDDYKMAQEKLEVSEEYLDQIVPNENFDHASWLLLSGKYALRTKRYIAARSHFEQALAEIPTQWTLRRAMTATGLTKAYAQMRERDKSLEVAENLVPLIQVINASMTNHWFTEYLQQDLLAIFPTDVRVHEFVTSAYQKLPHLKVASVGV